MHLRYTLYPGWHNKVNVKSAFERIAFGVAGKNLDLCTFLYLCQYAHQRLHAIRIFDQFVRPPF